MNKQFAEMIEKSLSGFSKYGLEALAKRKLTASDILARATKRVVSREDEEYYVLVRSPTNDQIKARITDRTRVGDLEGIIDGLLDRLNDSMETDIHGKKPKAKA
ncbi:MAG: hypothetical protein OEX12_00185 [Gammaproteobacteria bacterium]|nr:hypothetical protein [Gammaproteobacteria bacterium]